MALTLENLVEQQLETGGWITCMWYNTKKLGTANITSFTLVSRINKLEDYWNTFVSTRRMINGQHLAAESDYIKDKYFDKIEEQYFLNNAALAEELSKHQKTTPTSLVNMSNSAIAELTCTLDPTVRLPRVELPTFNGDLLQWESFRDQFRSMVPKPKT